MTRSSIRVLIGTKAQYIKTAPLLRLMQQRDVEYRLIDSGQHGAFSVALRQELGIKEPDVFIGGDRDIATVPAAVRWSFRIATQLASARSLRRDVFGPQPGICVVHGDTPSTLLGALLARRAGLEVAQLEAGLRSFNLLNPFPEELVRIAVMRIATYLFAEDQAAFDLLHHMGLGDKAVLLPENTVIEALSYALDGRAPAVQSGPAVVTLHRVENLSSRQRIEGLVTLVEAAASRRRVLFVTHPPTRVAFERYGVLSRLASAGVQLVDLLPHKDFVKAVAEAPFVITDGGSIQEECVLLGIPVLLWRGATERRDDLDGNAVLSEYSVETGQWFLARFEELRRPPADLTVQPSAVVLETLLESPSGPLRRDLSQ